MSMTSIALALLMSASLQTPAKPAKPATPAADDVGWLAGCWSFTRNGRHVIEHWAPAEGGTLIGMGRSVANGKTVEYEFLLIRSGAAGLEYVAKPSGQAEGIFTATRASATEVIFENPAHDFPKTVSYARNGDLLTAAIEGPMNGQTRRIEFPYAKASCTP